VQEAYAVFLFIKLIMNFGGGEPELRRKMRGLTVDQASASERAAALYILFSRGRSINAFHRRKPMV
jgi:hypothetical protein